METKIQNASRASAAHDLMKARIRALTTDLLIESIQQIERQHDAVEDRRSADAMALRVVRANLLDELEVRYPQIVAALEKWADEDLDDTRTYSQVAIDEVRKARP